MATEAGKAAARRAALAIMATRGWNPATLAKVAEIDPGTAGDFLLGKRWPKVSTLGRIDSALSLTRGTLAAIGEEVEPASQSLPVLDLHMQPTALLLTEIARRLGLNVIVDDGAADAELPTP